MNDSPIPRPARFSLRQFLGDLQTFARREPAQAMAVALGAGLLVNLLPKRAVVGTVTLLGAAVLHPTLIALGLTKALELCCQSVGNRCSPLPTDPRSSPIDSANARPSLWIKS
jgi:hypothetical protein